MGILREVWYKVDLGDPKTVATMRDHPVFKTPPQSQMILRDFDAPVDVADAYVQRLASYLQVNLQLTVKKARISILNGKSVCVCFFFNFPRDVGDALTFEYCHYCWELRRLPVL